MTTTHQVHDKHANFAHNEHGSVAIIFALLITVLMASIGAAIDVGRQYQAKAQYTDLMDGAVIAASRLKQSGGSDADAIAVAQAFVASAGNRYANLANVSFSISPAGSVVGQVNLDIPSTFLNAIGIPELAVRVRNEAKFGQGPDLEMALMLDVTGSMKGSKIADLKDAVEELIQIVVPDENKTRSADDAVRRIALAPFSSSVKLKSKQFEAATGHKRKGDKGCVVERVGAEAYTDAAPSDGQYVVSLEEVGGGKCEDGREVFPLTDKKSDLKKMVRSLDTGGATAGHIGTAWAWYVLSPAWAALFDDDEKPAPYTALTEKKPGGAPKLRKIALLMTDGEYNTQYSGVDSTTQARALCDNMKNSGIEVYTVGFAVGDSATVIATLQQCASSASHFYNAANGEALRSAFRDIALKASAIRISQ
jgi:Flp pilus assembly protein TadG